MAARSYQSLTKAIIDSLTPREVMFRIQDANVRGLSIQVTPGGKKSWVVRYVLGRRENTHTLGRWPEMTVDQARKAAGDVLTRVRAGEDPNTTKKETRAALTVKELAEKFIEDHINVRNKPSTIHEHTRLVNKIIIPELGVMVARDVTTDDIATLLTRLAKKTPVQANRVRALLSKMFAQAEIWLIRKQGTNPVKGQYKSEEHAKERFLSDKEILALGEAFRDIDAASTAGVRLRTNGPGPESPFPMAAIKLALLTGMRKSEMCGDAYKGIPPMPWTEIDLEAGVVKIPPERHKTGAKSGTRVVYLCQTAQRLLETLPRPLGSNLVFPGEVTGKPIVNLLKIWYRVRNCVAVTQEDKPKAEQVDISDVTLHDLRRTFGSVAARMGYPELFIASLLGHKAGTVTQIYARLKGDPLQEAAEAIGGRITNLLNGNPCADDVCAPFVAMK